MKTFISIALLSLVSLHAAVATAPQEIVAANAALPPQNDKELMWVDEQIRAILPARIGVSDGVINALKDPVKLKGKAGGVALSGANGLLPPPKLGASPLISVPKVVEEPLRLSAVMNKSALINGKWYKVGESVRAYSLAEVKPGSVLLSGKKGQKLILFLTKQNNNIKILTK